MNTKWIACPPRNETAEALAAATTAKETLAALYADAKARNATESMAKISEVQGLYAAYELTSHPEIVDAIILKLGSIIGELLGPSSAITIPTLEAEAKRRTAAATHVSQFNERVFMDGAPHLIYLKEWHAAYVQYLVSLGLSPQTIRIYKGKAAAALPNQAETIDMNDLKQFLTGELETRAAAPKKDHNALCAIRRFLDFLALLDRNAQGNTAWKKSPAQAKQPEITDFYGARIHDEKLGDGKLTRVYGEEIYITFDSGMSYIYKENAFATGSATFADPALLEPFNACYQQHIHSDAGNFELYDTWFHRGS